MFFVCFLQKTEDKNEKKINIPVDMKSKNVFFLLLCPFAGTLTSQINKNNTKSTLFFFRMDIISCMLYFFNINMLNYGFLRSSVFRLSCCLWILFIIVVFLQFILIIIGVFRFQQNTLFLFYSFFFFINWVSVFNRTPFYYSS